MVLGRKKQPEVGSAAAHLWAALSELTRAAGRWLALQPATQGVYGSGERLRARSGQVADDVSAWASNTVHDVGDAAGRARRGTQRLVVNLVIVALLAYLVDWVLSENRPATAGRSASQ